MGSLACNESLLQDIEQYIPEAPSRTISLVGPCGTGKSSIIRAITPRTCAKPAISQPRQTVPTSGDVTIFDTTLAPTGAGSEFVRILDIEGFGGAKEKLPKDLQGGDDFAQKRWDRVQEFPRLCYALSDVIVYVETAPIARDLTT